MILDRLTLLALVASWVVLGYACYRAGRAERADSLDAELRAAQRLSGAWDEGGEESAPAARVLPSEQPVRQTITALPPTMAVYIFDPDGDDAP